MNIQTHRCIDPELVGVASLPEEGRSVVTLTTTPRMAADETGLVHGGFVFDAVDYAAMTAVNHPMVVLGVADVRFLKPVRVGETLHAHAKVGLIQGKKRQVSVYVYCNEQEVFNGSFICFVLERHVSESS